MRIVKVLQRLLGMAAVVVSLMAAETANAAGTRTAFDMQRSIDRLVAAGAPGALGLVHAGGMTQLAAAGYADRATGRTVAEGDVWRIASVTKLVTAVVVLQLVGEGRLKLTDTVGRHLPDQPARVEALRIEDLLAQTTGIPEYLTVGDEVFSSRAITRLLTRRPSQSTLVAHAIGGTWRRAGETHDYANTNYVLLGSIVEAVTQQSLAAVVDERVFRKLTLVRTGFVDERGRMPEPYVRAYLPRDGRKGPLTDYSRFTDVTVHPYATGGDGGIYATAADLDMLLAAIADGRLLSPALARRMTADLKMAREGRYRYGLGIMAFDLPCGVRIFGHEGRDIGLTTLAFWDPSNGRRLVLMVNTVADGSDGLDTALTEVRNDTFCARRLSPGHARGS